MNRIYKNRYKAVTSVFFYLGSLVAILSLVGTSNTARNLYTQATGLKANLIVDTKGVIGTLNRPWQYLAQGGEEDNYRMNIIQDKLTPLKPKYIRLDHIYTYYTYISRNPQGQLEFDFTKLTNIISDIQAIGAKPFISLSYMPSALNQNDLTGLPSNWLEWQLVVQKTIEHVSGANGLNISDVYYEVWNEPDLFGYFKTYGNKNYLTLYHNTVLGAQQAQNTQPYKIGGPATTALYRNWVTKLIDYVTQHNLPLDFYSWHRYDYNPSTYLKDIRNFEEWIRDYPELGFSIERIISEWGPDSEINRVYDTDLSAAHLIAVMAEVFPFVSQMYTFEIQDGLDPQGSHYWGRWGMLTHQTFGSQPKPRYHASLLLSGLGNQRLSLIGQGTWIKAIAAKKNNTTQLLITNYDVRSSNVETVPITFMQLDPGTYQFSQHYLNRLPTLTTIEITSSNPYTHQVTLYANSAVLLELTPINP